MSTKVIQCAFGLICALGVAVVGIGWRHEAPPRHATPQHVFCSIAELEKCHPAWTQYVQIGGLVSPASDVSQDSGQGSIAANGIYTSVHDQAPSVQSVTRAELQARLEQRAEKELADINDQLNASVQRQVSEKRQELEAQMSAKDAEERRNAEQALAETLRQLDELHRYERVDSAIKLAALKAQLSVRGIAQDSVRSAIAAKETELSALSHDEDALRRQASAQRDSSRVDRMKSTQQFLASLESRESKRVKNLILSRRETLHKELNGNGLGTAAISSSVAPDIVSYSGDAGSVAERMRVSGKADYASAASASKSDLVRQRQELRKRMDAELEAVVTRIARDNNLEVTFESNSKSKDMTAWFRHHLPYATARR